MVQSCIHLGTCLQQSQAIQHSTTSINRSSQTVHCLVVDAKEEGDGEGERKWRKIVKPYIKDGSMHKVLLE